MLQGICVPVCTPFTGTNQAFDEKKFLSHIDWMLENKVHIICVCGGTGEFAFLSKEERLHMTEIAAKKIDGQAKLLVQTSAVRTEEAIEYSKHAEGVGADALMILPPYFEGPSHEGVFNHFERISAAIKTPIMLYNIPEASNYDITPEMYTRLAALPNVAYIKDSTGEFLRLEQLVAVGAKVFCGFDCLSPHALMAGAAGCFWGGANIMPKQSVQLYNLYKEGKIAEMFALWESMKAANVFILSASRFVSAVKAGMRIIGRDMGDCRFPQEPLLDEEVVELKKHLQFLL